MACSGVEQCVLKIASQLTATYAETIPVGIPLVDSRALGARDVADDVAEDVEEVRAYGGDGRARWMMRLPLVSSKYIRPALAQSFWYSAATGSVLSMPSQSA